MKILIHACPERMWYVENFLVPGLEAQGAEDIEVWNDTEKRGNLMACMESFKARHGNGSTWHIQDDVLPCRDFVKRCQDYDGVVYGFTCGRFGDDIWQTGKVYAPDVWHSFQCVLIPDEYARECAEWFFSGEWAESTLPELPILKGANKGDDTFFREFLQIRHGREMFTNINPNLVEHVDWLVGGSVLSQWRGFIPRSSLWNDEELVLELKREIKRFRGA